MAKSVMFAVAGSGKTTTLIERLTLDQRALIITYTENNYAHLQRSIIRKFGFLPPNISLFTYFGFLNGFCYRPQLERKRTGITPCRRAPSCAAAARPGRWPS
ncbi:DNA helicase UvrD, partial [Pseudomonas aeruginosa]|nr:DNA helicase UvrD [Pseudomonas aeruginosa]MCT0653587.1 DNA helicase UvrD [Pseudomonas aeruginosa]